MWNCNIKPNLLLPSFKKLLVYGTCYAFDYFIPEFNISSFTPETIDVQKTLLGIKKNKFPFKFNKTFNELSNFDKLYSMYNVLNHVISDDTEPPEICAWNESSLSGIIEFIEMAIQLEIVEKHYFSDNSEIDDSYNSINNYARRLVLDAYRKMFTYLNKDTLEELEIKGVLLKTPFYDDPSLNENMDMWRIILDDFRHYLICGTTYNQIHDNNQIDGYFKTIDLNYSEKEFVDIIFELRKIQESYKIKSFTF